jgi:DNA topoisomerase-3
METAGREDFDDDTEKKGLGTPATRAAIIEKLVRGNFVIRKGKQILSTEAGRQLIEVLPEDVKSPKMTAEWENILMQIERGKSAPQEFMTNIVSMVNDLITKYSSLSEEETKRFSNIANQKEEIGVCPRCGKPVYESTKNFYCSNRECKFSIWKDNKLLTNANKKLTKSMVAALLKNGRVNVTGMYSPRTDKKYNATLVLNDTGEYVNLDLEFPNTSTQKEEIGPCPRCGSPVYESAKSFRCSNDKCLFCLWKDNKFLSSMKKTVTKSMATSLLKNGRVNVRGLYSQRTGKTFDATLVLSDTGDYANFSLEFPKNDNASKNKSQYSRD